ncbi:hypothetical protein [Bradyrhizobium sp. SYSU BS000235]|uniref:hypothetical protein n=1 Tax=Bradyrhizobium sp. SYSU BS000235 TaxID=3411332 RepID=UPI003C77F1E4
MRIWIYSTAAALAAFCSLSTGPANALPADRLAAPSAVEQTQFIFGGRNYCWYDAGWHGPGFYWCGYAMRRGFGWGGGAGWRGWNHRAVRPHIGRPGRPVVRPGRPGGRPGGGHGGGRPGGGHGGGHHHR